MRFLSIPWLMFWLLLLLAGLSLLFHFNGLYGQDAHEYFRQFRVFHDRIRGLPVSPPGPGDASYGAVFPLTGLLISWLTGPYPVVLQLVIWCAAALSLFLFDRINRFLSPGVHARTRILYAILFISSPVFFRSAMVGMSDSLALAFLLAAVYFFLLAAASRQLKPILLAGFFSALALSTRQATAVLLLPIGLYTAYQYLAARKLVWIPFALLVTLTGFIPHIWARYTGGNILSSSSLAGQWEWGHLFSRKLASIDGYNTYFLPNILHVLSPLCHPAFFLLLPLLFFLFKKTDLYLPEKKVLLTCLVLYSLMLAGLPVQNNRYLLLSWPFLLFLLFPAFDRFYSYGMYFLQKYTLIILYTGAGLQLIFIGWYFRPILQRAHFEARIANAVEQKIPGNAILYTMDVDIALITSLPGIEYRNMWAVRYDSFTPGAWVLFNEPRLRAQWEGKNPVLNWEKMVSEQILEQPDTLVDGWILWKIKY